MLIPSEIPPFCEKVCHTYSETLIVLVEGLTVNYFYVMLNFLNY